MYDDRDYTAGSYAIGRGELVKTEARYVFPPMVGAIWTATMNYNDCGYCWSSTSVRNMALNNVNDETSYYGQSTPTLLSDRCVRTINDPTTAP